MIATRVNQITSLILSLLGVKLTEQEVEKMITSQPFKINEVEVTQQITSTDLPSFCPHNKHSMTISVDSLRKCEKKVVDKKFKIKLLTFGTLPVALTSAFGQLKVTPSKLTPGCLALKIDDQYYEVPNQVDLVMRLVQSSEKVAMTSRQIIEKKVSMLSDEEQMRQVLAEALKNPELRDMIKKIYPTADELLSEWEESSEGNVKIKVRKPKNSKDEVVS